MNYKMAFLASVTSLTLIGCGSADSSGDSFNSIVTGTGSLEDRKVQGIYYVSGSHTGYTDSNGTFVFEKGKPVIFSIGGIKVYKIDSNITDNTLQGSILRQPVNERAASFLQSIQDDNNSTSLVILPQVRTALQSYGALDFIDSNASISETDLNTTINTLLTTTLSDINTTDGKFSTRRPVSIIQARSELYATIDSVYKDMNGTYSGSYENTSHYASCSQSGTITISADINRTSTSISGTATSSNVSFNITGNMTQKGVFEGVVKASGYYDTIWNGTFAKDSNGSLIIGTYTDNRDCNGTFKVTKQ